MKDAYGEALAAYDEAGQGLKEAVDGAEPGAVGEIVAAGRRAMAAARASL